MTEGEMLLVGITAVGAAAIAAARSPTVREHLSGRHQRRAECERGQRLERIRQAMDAPVEAWHRARRAVTGGWVTGELLPDQTCHTCGVDVPAAQVESHLRQHIDTEQPTRRPAATPAPPTHAPTITAPAARPAPTIGGSVDAVDQFGRAITALADAEYTDLGEYRHAMRRLAQHLAALAPAMAEMADALKARHQLATPALAAHYDAANLAYELAADVHRAPQALVRFYTERTVMDLTEAGLPVPSGQFMAGA